MIDDRGASALVSWVGQRDAGWRAAVTAAALDPYRGHAAALRTALPHAVCALDAFPSSASASPPSTTCADASSTS